jgi:hypothetical protein
MKTAFNAVGKYMLIVCIIIYIPARAQLNVTTINFPFNSESEYKTGIVLPSANQLTYLSPLLGLGLIVNVQVSAAGNLICTTNPSLSIPIGDIQIQNTGITGASPTTAGSVINLSGTTQVIGNSLLILLQTATFAFQYSATGGADFLVPAGTYSTTLTYTVTNLGIIKSSATATLSVTISSINAVSLQGAGNIATLTFSTPANYENGVQITQPAALNIFSTLPYHVSVSAPNLNYMSNTIPIGNVNINATPSTSNASITTTIASLLSSAQTIITSGIPTLSQNFDLLYSTGAGNNAFLNKPAGTYTSTLTYTITSP